MEGPGAKAPTPRRAIGLELQIDDAARPSPRDLETMIGAVDANFAEAQRSDEE